MELPRRRCSGDGKRRLVTKLTIGLVLLLFAVPSAATAQQPRKVYRVGYLYEGVPHSEALSEGLRDLGWVLGENLVIEYRQADGPPEHLQALLTDLLQLNVDVIVVVNTRLATAGGYLRCPPPPAHRARGEEPAPGVVHRSRVY